MRHRAIGQWSRPLEPLKSISHYPNQCQATGFRHICSPSHQAALLKEENGLQPDSRPGLGHADLVYPGGPADQPAQIALGQGADRRTAGAPVRPLAAGQANLPPPTQRHPEHAGRHDTDRPRIPLALRHLRAGNEEHERLDFRQREAGAVDAEALQAHVQIPEPATTELQTPQSPGSHLWR